MKRTLIIVITILTAYINTAWGEDGWEITIYAKTGNAENRIVIGQDPDATDGIDGRYDVPAFLAGDIEAYSMLEGSPYWKDMRNTCISECAKRWTIIVDSSKKGEAVQIRWSNTTLPDGLTALLVDAENGDVIDMGTESKYVFEYTGRRELIVEVERE